MIERAWIFLHVAIPTDPWAVKILCCLRGKFMHFAQTLKTHRTKILDSQKAVEQMDLYVRTLCSDAVP